MKCYNVGVLQAYIDGELSADEMMAIALHLDKCSNCQKQFEQLVEIENWSDEKIKCEPHGVADTDKAWETFNKLVAQDKIIDLETVKNKKRGVFSEMKKIKKYMSLTAAVLLVVSVPVVALNVYNLFSEHVLNDDVVNKGMTRGATKNGQFQPLDIKLTDQGITVHLTELYVANTRVSVHYRVEDEDGKLLPVTYDTEGLDLKYDGIVDGNQVDSPEVYVDKEEGSFSVVPFLGCKDYLPFELMENGKPLNIGIRELGEKNEGTITFVGYDKIKYPTVLDIDIDKIGTVEGKWKGQIEIHKQ